MLRDLQLSVKDLQLSVREATSIFDLPDDHLGEIFSRLPARSLLICQCVCKRFSKVIKNPKFIAIHVNRAITSNTTTFCSVSVRGKTETDESGSNVIVEDRYDHILLHNTDRSVSSSYVRLSNPITCEISIVGSCNGLFCAELMTPGDKHGSYMLIWNPLTRENRYVAKPKIYASGIASAVAIAFGFTPKTNDYKVVRIICNYGSGKPLQVPDDVVVSKIEVYKMSTDDWSTYQVTTLPCCEPDHMPPQVDPIILSGIFCRRITRPLRGAFHWLSSIHWLSRSRIPGIVEGTSKAIVSFDLEEEQVKLFTVLDPCKIPHLELAILDRLNDSLSLIVPDNMSLYSSFDIWVMNDYGNRNSWTKQFTVDQFGGLARPIGCWKDDVFLMAGMMMEQRYLCFYNLKTQNLKFFPVNWHFYFANLCDYVETLETASRAIAVAGEASSEV